MIDPQLPSLVPFLIGRSSRAGTQMSGVHRRVRARLDTTAHCGGTSLPMWALKSAKDGRVARSSSGWRATSSPLVLMAFEDPTFSLNYPGAVMTLLRVGETRGRGSSCTSSWPSWEDTLHLCLIFVHLNSVSKVFAKRPPPSAPGLNFPVRLWLCCMIFQVAIFTPQAAWAAWKARWA